MKDISLHILDLAQNCLSAGATTITIEIREDVATNEFTLNIKDNGKGIAPEHLPKVANPYFTTRKTRKVGLGLPFLKQNAEAAGGSFSISSQVGVGTTTSAVFGHDHFDRPPLGDIAGVLVLMAGANPQTRFVYTHTTPEGSYTFDSEETRDALDGLPLSEYSIMVPVKEMINANLETIKAK